MLRTPLVPSQSLSNNVHSYQQIPLFNQRPNEVTDLSSDDGTSNNNGFVKKVPTFRDPSNTTLVTHHPTSSSMGSSGHSLLQSRASESSLAASVALVQQNSSQKQSAFDIPISSHRILSPRQINGGIHASNMSQIHAGHNECRAKYDRLLEAHRKLQRTNGALEDKLLRIVEKYEGEKNNMRMDLASQTQKLVESKLMIQQLHDQNSELQSDLQLSINLLRNRPTSFMSQRLDTLPPDIQQRVRGCLAENARDRELQRLSRGPPEGRKIRIAIPSDDNTIGGTSITNGTSDSDKISAAILAKVLEERDKERQGDKQLRIDVGTQTHGWNHFPGSDKIHAPASSSSSSSTASCINKEICELTNEVNKCESSNLSSPENSSLTERLSPTTMTKSETLIDATTRSSCDGVSRFLRNTDFSLNELAITTSTVQHQSIRENGVLNFVTDGNSAQDEPYLASNLNSNSCQTFNNPTDTAFISQPSHPNGGNNLMSSSSVSTTTNSMPITSSNLTRSSSTVNSTIAQSNVYQSPRLPMTKPGSLSFSASATSSYLTRSATFSVKQTDI